MSKSDESELATLSGLYEAYASQHVGHGTEEAAALVDRPDIRPLLPRPVVGPLVDPRGGEMVREADGFDAKGTDILPEQAALALAAGATQVRQRDFRANIAAHPAPCRAIATTFLLEDPTKREVLQTFDEVAVTVALGDIFVGTVPNTVSSLEDKSGTGAFVHQRRSPRGTRQLTSAGRLRLDLRAFFPASRARTG